MRSRCTNLFAPLLVSLLIAGAGLGCSDRPDAATPTEPSAGPTPTQRWDRLDFTVQEDVLNPCNGEIIHLTTDFRFASRYPSNGRIMNRMSGGGHGVSDEGTQYTSRVEVIVHALLPNENNIGHEWVVGSAPGSSFTSILRVKVAEKGRSLLRDEIRCR